MALVFSQDMVRVQPEAAWSKEMVKFSIGEESFGDFHVDASEIVAGAGIGGAPFAGFLADDELPFVGVGHGEDGVAAGGNGGAADVEIGVGDEGGRFICAGAPDLAVGNEITENFAALHARAGVSDLDGFSAGELAFGVGGRTGAAGFVLRAS